MKESCPITDVDLLEQLEATSNLPEVQRRVKKRMQAIQSERNEAKAKRESMTPVQRRRDLVRETLNTDPLEQPDIYHIHSVLALCGLPYKRPMDDIKEYDTQYGRMSLSVESGRLLDPHTGTWVRQGIPYGPKARLMQLHICTRAIRQQSPVIELESNMSAFMRSVGFSVTGGAKGTIAQFKEQLNRLAGCTIRIGLWDGKDRAKTFKIEPIESFEVWFPDDPDQKMLWPSKLTLSQKFYDSLIQHALPVDMRSLNALSHSAKQMDMLLWLSYRIKELDKSYFLTWELMKEQFCQSEGRRLIDFQRQFKEDLRDIEEVFEKTLPLELTDKGIWLRPCEVEKLFVPPKIQVKKRHESI